VTEASTGFGLHHLSASEAAARISAGEITSEELVAACLEQIEAREGTVGAWEFLDPELALSKARGRDREEPRGLLHGVPVGLKDIIDTADMPTACGTPIYEGRRPPADARCVELLNEAGAVMLGKTVTTELATWHPGKTRNPHNPEHTPGGSSSGSAAAVAARMVPLALGTQTVGSTIRPAAFCGVLGMKPTLDAVDLTGVRPTSKRLDTLGLFGRSPADLHLLLVVLNALVPAKGAPASPLRVALVRTPWWSQADPDSRAAIERAAELMREGGAEVGERDLPPQLDDLDQVHDIVASVDIAAYCAREYDEHADLLSERMQSEIERGRAIDPARYEEAVRKAEVCARLFDSSFAEFDVVLTPAVTGEAPHGLEWTGEPIFLRPWSMLGLPAATVPVGMSASGLPIGVQLVGRRAGDRAVLEAADRLFDGLGDGAVPLPPS
jgi:amidase